MKRLVVILMVVAVVSVLSAGAFAQKEPPKYDAKTEITLKKAVVQDVKEVTLPKGQNRFRLIVKAGLDTYEVCLCPKTFLHLSRRGRKRSRPPRKASSSSPRSGLSWNLGQPCSIPLTCGCIQ